MWLKELFKRRKKQEKDPKEGVQTFKEFIEWFNERVADGFWGGASTPLICMDIYAYIKKFPFWRREKEFQKLKDELNKEIIIPVNEAAAVEDNKKMWEYFQISISDPCEYIAENLEDAAKSLQEEKDKEILAYMNETEEKEND